MRQTPWIVAAVIIVLALGGILYRVSLGTSPAPSPDMANAGNATPGAGAGVPAGRAPDISRMSPKERFDRLNDRVMQAAEKGDSAFVSNFTPMAVAAYEQLDTVDVDTRYHAALLHLGVGETAPALALADTILSESKNNLFGYLVRATVAEKKGDAAEVARNRTAFAAHYAAEIAKPRPEYVDHRGVIDAFAQSAPPAAK